jgi:hypothetical protein
MTNIDKEGEPQQVVTLDHPTFPRKSSSTTRTSHGNSQGQRKSLVGRSDDGGDKNPHKNFIEKSHTIPGSIKRKREFVEKES